MTKQADLVSNAQKHLSGNTEVMEDLVEIHHLGAIPRYHGHLRPNNGGGDFPTTLPTPIS